MIRFALFIALPLVEMAILIWTGERIGLLPTLGIVILTGIAGAALVKRQGLAVWAAARTRLADGALPTRELAHGAMLLVSGAFLLTPGFITDLTGFALLIPAAREWLRRGLGSRLVNRYGRGTDRTVRVDVWR